MNEIEEKFFKTFGIEHIERYQDCSKNAEGICENTCDFCDYYKDVYCYPPITDRILLELICIVFHTFYKFDIDKDFTVETLKERVLRMLIIAKDDVYNEIQSLFESEGADE